MIICACCACGQRDTLQIMQINLVRYLFLRSVASFHSIVYPLFKIINYKTHCYHFLLAQLAVVVWTLTNFKWPFLTILTLFVAIYTSVGHTYIYTYIYSYRLTYRKHSSWPQYDFYKDVHKSFFIYAEYSKELVE